MQVLEKPPNSSESLDQENRPSDEDIHVAGDSEREALARPAQKKDGVGVEGERHQSPGELASMKGETGVEGDLET